MISGQTPPHSSALRGMLQYVVATEYSSVGFGSLWKHENPLVMSPLMRSHCYLVATLKSQPVVMVASFKANARPRSQDQEHSLLKVLACTFGLGDRELWSCSKLSPCLVWGSENPLARKTSTSCALRFYVQVAWYFYVHFLSITSTCTSTCALHDKPRFDWEDDFNFIVYVIYTMNTLTGLEAGIDFVHFSFFPTRESFCKTRDFYSWPILKSLRSPFARLIFVRSDFYSRGILKTLRFLFARLVSPSIQTL